MKFSVQAPPMTDKEIEAYLIKSRRARVSTQNKDGTIHTIPVAYKYQNGELYFISGLNTRKTKNVRRNSKITVLIDTDNYPEPFMGVMIYGIARITDEDVFQSYQALYEDFTTIPREKIIKYIDALIEHYDFVVIRVQINKIVSFDYGKDEIYRDKVDIHLK